MVEIEIDGKKVEVQEGSMVIEAATGKRHSDLLKFTVSNQGKTRIVPFPIGCARECALALARASSRS